jgi:hypothetical protein
MTNTEIPTVHKPNELQRKALALITLAAERGFDRTALLVMAEDPHPDFAEDAGVTFRSELEGRRAFAVAAHLWRTPADEAADARRAAEARMAPEGECNACDAHRANGDRDFPRHQASDRCESGHHNHCTCDTCW